ncbi:MAG: hypothetical protein NC337_09385 [Roseburia sp.]|nr:hypothetical protein [Roseburia sp.]
MYKTEGGSAGCALRFWFYRKRCMGRAADRAKNRSCPIEFSFVTVWI